MSVAKQWWRRALPLRALGVGLAITAVAAVHFLAGMVHAGPRHEPTSLEMLLAAVGFLGLSIGGGLTLLGAHIHDKMEVAARWRTSSTDRQQSVHLVGQQLADR